MREIYTIIIASENNSKYWDLFYNHETLGNTESGCFTWPATTW